MASEADEIQRLIQTTTLTLTPATVPPHRTLDISFLSDRSQPDTTAFCDLFWAQPGRLACCAVQVGGGAAGRLAAHALKAVLRAALRSHAADQALALGLRAFETYGPDLPVDVAMATISTRDGTTTIGTHRSGAASCLAAGAPRAVVADTRVRLARGEALRLSVGTPVLAWPAISTAAADVVRALVDATPGSAAAAIVFNDYSEADAGTFVLCNDVEDISPLLVEIGAYLSGHGVGAAAWTAFELALDELLTNIVIYAYRDGGVHEVLIDVRVKGDALHVDIRDDGVPFDPTSIPPPDLEAGLDDRPLGGLGLHFARTVFDAIGYRRVRGWNVLSLSKTLSIAPA